MFDSCKIIVLCNILINPVIVTRQNLFGGPCVICRVKINGCGFDPNKAAKDPESLYVDLDVLI